MSDRTRRGSGPLPRRGFHQDRPPFTGANHICVVTSDLDGAVRRWWDRYGIGPRRVFSYDRSNMRAKVDGVAVEFKMRAA